VEVMLVILKDRKGDVKAETVSAVFRFLKNENCRRHVLCLIKISSPLLT